MKIYISGPMSGHDAMNEPAFRGAADYVTGHGHDAVVPHDIVPWQHDGECPPAYTADEKHSAACYLRGDLAVMLSCDAVLMLPDWDRSVGSRIEQSVAAHCGMTIFYPTQGSNGRITLSSLPWSGTLRSS